MIYSNLDSPAEVGLLSEEKKPSNDPIWQMNELLGGRWKMKIMLELIGGPKRFGELRRSLSGISQKVLAAALHDMEQDELVTRIVFPESILKVVYSLTQIGYKLTPILRTITICIAEYEAMMENPPAKPEKIGLPIKPLAYYEHTNTEDNHTVSFHQRIREAVQKIQQAEYIVVGTGTGMNPSLRHFNKEDAQLYFPKLYEKGLHTIDDMINFYSQIFDNNAVQFWTFWAKYLWHVLYKNPPAYSYRDLIALTEGKHRFFLSTDADAQFERAGVPQQIVYRPHGNYLFLQCAFPCEEKLYETWKYIEPMLNRIDRGEEIRPEDIPHCASCGDFLVPNHFRCKTVSLVPSKEGATQTDFSSFLTSIGEKNAAFVEVCAGLRRPNLIRNPLENYAGKHDNTWLIRINSKFPLAADPKNQKKTLSFDEQENRVLANMVQYLHNAQNPGGLEN